MSSNRVLIIAGIVLFGLLCGAFGHSYVTNPTSRSNQKSSQTGCRGPACLGPCDVKLASKTRAAIATTRGSTITIQWPRNNHAGGFIRFAWAPTAQSDSHSAFDSHVQQINCHEVGGCKPSNPSDPNGGDSGPADGSSSPCQSTLRVPSDLSDGAWTLQWAWFGGAFALGDYYSCVDYQVSGGSALVGQTVAPVFVGGDYTYPGQNKCKFFNTDKLHQCVNEPCNNPVYSGGERSGPAAGVASSSSSGTVPVPTVPTVPAVPTIPSSTSTSSGRVSTSTSTSTSGRVSTSTSSSSSGSSASCVTGNTRCATSETFATCVYNSWVTQSCAPGTVCKQNGGAIFCDFP